MTQEAKDYRLLLRGIEWDDAWIKRFASFGNVSHVHFPIHPDGIWSPKGSCAGTQKGFGFLTLHATPTRHRKCNLYHAHQKKVIKTFQNTLSKGRKIEIEDAKRDYTQRLAIEQSQIKHNLSFPPGPSKKSLKRKKISHSPEINVLVRDEDLYKPKKGWKRGRFGRAIVLFHTRDPVTRRIKTIDPMNYKNNIWKWDGLKVQEKPVSQLTWEMDPVAPRIREQRVLKEPFIWHNDPALLKHQRLQGRSGGQAVLDPDSLFDGEDYDDPEARALREERMQMLRLARGWDSDGSENKEKGIVEFDHAPMDISMAEPLLEAYQDTQESKGNTLEEEHIEETASETSQLFDDAMSDLFSGVMSTGDSGQVPVVDNQRVQEQEQDTAPTGTETTVPITSEAPAHPDRILETPIVHAKYQVNTNLRSLVFSSESFSLFSPTDVPATTGDGLSMHVDETVLEPQDPKEEARRELEIRRSFATSRLFFLHMDHPELGARSCFDPSRTFHRMKSVQEIERAWQETRQEATQEYKRKHKYATRRRSKMRKM